jgi:hypothetical protein
MTVSRKTARIAGLLYLLVAMTGAFSIMYVPETLIVPGNATATAERITSSELLFRTGIASGLICQIAFIFLVLKLHHLLKDVDHAYASAMVVLALVAVPIAFLNMLNNLAALILLDGAEFLSAFSTTQLRSLMMLFLSLHEQGIVVVQMFWGLWLFPFGVLVFKSRFLPRALGVLLVIACFAYLTDSFTALLLPRYKDAVSSFTAGPAGLGEFAIMLWLLIRGVKTSADSAVPRPGEAGTALTSA